MMPEKRYMTKKEMAYMYSVSQSFIQQAIDSGELEVRNISSTGGKRAIRISIEAADEFFRWRDEQNERRLARELAV